MEIPIRRITDWPFAGTAVQGQSRYEVSVRAFEAGQLLISGALAVRTL
jgi:hypothetical protein